MVPPDSAAAGSVEALDAVLRTVPGIIIESIMTKDVWRGHNKIITSHRDPGHYVLLK